MTGIVVSRLRPTTPHAECTSTTSVEHLRMNSSDMTTGTAARLHDEARFADHAYSQLSDELGINEVFFQKYASPVADWDWRQWGAKRLGPVRGAKLLDYGCGAGEEATYLARMGAHVTAIDISPIGVHVTNERAKKNGLTANLTATLMRCDPTDFPDESFDVVHGFGILHHVGLRTGLMEVRRLLRPGGRGLFFEHMGNSPLVESIRPKEGHYTASEAPVRWAEVIALSGNFSRLEAQPFHVISRLKRFVPLFAGAAVKRLDHTLLRTFPSMRHFASGLVIYLEK
jgi:2-polyprenyl-3-methyl-5-hydroxy-6-metoxy-1,4-benzoquinol methylase